LEGPLTSLLRVEGLETFRRRSCEGTPFRSPRLKRFSRLDTQRLDEVNSRSSGKSWSGRVASLPSTDGVSECGLKCRTLFCGDALSLSLRVRSIIGLVKSLALRIFQLRSSNILSYTPVVSGQKPLSERGEEQDELTGSRPSNSPSQVIKSLQESNSGRGCHTGT
jgi:hypothetical protein